LGPGRIMLFGECLRILCPLAYRPVPGSAEACIQVGHWLATLRNPSLVTSRNQASCLMPTPTSFVPHILLNTLGKLVEKMLSQRMQFYGVHHSAFHLTSWGLSQHSTEDGGNVPTHLLQAGWATKLQPVWWLDWRSLPSLHHDVLMVVIQKAGFPPVAGGLLPLLSSLVRRPCTSGTTLCLGSFAVVSGLAGLGLSPSLSCLYYIGQSAIVLLQANLKRSCSFFPSGRQHSPHPIYTLGRIYRAQLLWCHFRFSQPWDCPDLDNSSSSTFPCVGGSLIPPLILLRSYTREQPLWPQVVLEVTLFSILITL